MDIIFVIFRAYPPYIGGNEIEAINTARALVEKGANVRIFSADLSSELEPELNFEKGITIHRFPSFHPRDALWFSPALFRALLRLKSESIVHTISIHIPAFEAAIASRINNKISLISEPIYDFIEPDGSISLKYKIAEFLLGREILRSAKKIRCLSEGEKRLIVKRTNVKASKCVVIPVPLNTFWLEYASELKKQRLTSSGTRKILYVGRLVPHKGVHYLIESFATLLHHSNENNIELHIVGDGPEKTLLQKRAADLGINRRVKFPGFLPNEQLYYEYAEADLFVLPSRHEVYSIALMEALALNIPAMVLDIDIFKEWIAAGQLIGIEYPVNIENMAHQMWQCLTGEIKLNKFTPMSNDEITENLVRLYSEL